MYYRGICNNQIINILDSWNQYKNHAKNLCHDEKSQKVRTSKITSCYYVWMQTYGFRHRFPQFSRCFGHVRSIVAWTFFLDLIAICIHPNEKSRLGSFRLSFQFDLFLFTFYLFTISSFHRFEGLKFCLFFRFLLSNDSLSTTVFEPWFVFGFVSFLILNCLFFPFLKKSDISVVLTF